MLQAISRRITSPEVVLYTVEPQVLATLAWTMSFTGEHDPKLFQRICMEANGRIGGFSRPAHIATLLAAVAWASDPVSGLRTEGKTLFSVLGPTLALRSRE